MGFGLGFLLLQDSRLFLSNLVFGRIIFNSLGALLIRSVSSLPSF